MNSKVQRKNAVMTSGKCQELPSGNDPLIFIVPTNPKPISYVALDVCKSAVISVADSDRPNFADFLEVK